jgi:hypothetical protein
MFITALTSARYVSLSWVSSIQSTPPHPTFWRSILILFSHLRLGLPSSLFPPNTCRNSFPKYCRSYSSCRHNGQGFAVIKSGTSVTCQMHVMALAIVSMRHLWETGVVQWGVSVRLLYPLRAVFLNLCETAARFFFLQNEGPVPTNLLVTTFPIFLSSYIKLT